MAFTVGMASACAVLFVDFPVSVIPFSAVLFKALFLHHLMWDS